jgi:8-oxo-dGTP pyrophosphatase MutT (NUDIX family)
MSASNIKEVNYIDRNRYVYVDFYFMSDTYCNNCGKPGHIYNQCKIPITSFGVIAFRYSKTGANDGEILSAHDNGCGKEPEFLMIRRKDTLGYIDFMRGKYLVQNKNYIMNMLKQMTTKERALLKSGDFDKLWKNLWGENTVLNKYKTEEISSKEKYDLLYSGILNKNVFFTLSSMVDESDAMGVWDEPEWGFPKGRRNYQEKDYECAVREFCEETGYSSECLKNIQNIFPFEEIFTGSNYKSYKHKYYLMYMDYDDSLISTNFESSEVSKMEWKKFDDCINVIRPYNLEKKRMLTNIYHCIQKYVLCHS